MWVNLLDKMLTTIVQKGTLVVTLWDGTVTRYGDETGTPVPMMVRTPAILRHMLTNPELGFPEAYVDGDLVFEDDDPTGFLTLALTNMVAGNKTRWQKTLAQGRRSIRIAKQWNPMGRAQKNVAHHYDLSGELYDLFLDADKQYSCGYFLTPDDTLEQAQSQKKAHIAAKLLLEPDMRVLDIGCGWGGMAITLARDYGVHVLGVTLSAEQHKSATERVRAAGLEDRVEIRLADYRTVTETFDRIVSVGMFEHVGAPHYREYFSHIREKLTEDGVALIHTIGRAFPPGFTHPWILKYIFPGGYVPAMSEVMRAVEKEDLWATDVEVWRLHYAETLRHWNARFCAKRARVEELYDARFFRMWRFYLVASELTFRHSKQCVFQFQLARNQAAVPLSRDYLYQGDHQPMQQAAE